MKVQYMLLYNLLLLNMELAISNIIWNCIHYLGVVALEQKGPNVEAWRTEKFE